MEAWSWDWREQSPWLPLQALAVWMCCWGLQQSQHFFILFSPSMSFVLCGLWPDLLGRPSVFPTCPPTPTRIQGFILMNRVVYERAQKTEEITEPCQWAHLSENHSNHIILWFHNYFLGVMPQSTAIKILMVCFIR